MDAEIRDLTPRDYELFRRLVYAKSGINLGDHKTQLVRARLGKRVRERGLRSFREYYRCVEQDESGEELCALLDAISTNTTHLFREAHHFQFLRTLLDGWLCDQNWLAGRSALRIWSAGCSSGEEAYSIAMVAHDVLRRHRQCARPTAAARLELKILATDLSTRMLDRARLGRYEAHRVGTVPAPLRQRYLRTIRVDGQAFAEVVPELRRMITFAHFNLMQRTFPFRHGFDVIFCRNVMIYFDRPTQEALVNRFTRHLLPGGYLLIGHSESLTGISHSLKYVEPTIYRKG